MSFSIAASGKKDELVDKLNQRFEQAYTDPAPGVRELVNVGVDAVDTFADASTDEGNFSVSISGHAKQSDTDRDYISISISATS